MTGEIGLLSPRGDELDQIMRLAPEGVQVTWVDSTQPLDRQVAQLKNAVAIIVIPSEIPVELVRSCPNLKLVQVISAGTNLIDLPALGELGVHVANNGGANSIAVSEHTIALMVGVYRKLQLQLQSVKAREWAGGIRDAWFFQAHELAGKTVGIIGMGRIGRQVAKRLLGWECTLLYNDIVGFGPELEEEFHVTGVSMEELLRKSDVVTLHVPLTRLTRGMIADGEFDLMKPTAVLINACRGPVVDEAALIRALNNGKISAAGLDVLEAEPTAADNPLLDMDNVLITPHMASFAQESFEKMRAFAVQNAARVAEGAEPESVVLPE